MARSPTTRSAPAYAVERAHRRHGQAAAQRLEPDGAAEAVPDHDRPLPAVHLTPVRTSRMMTRYEVSGHRKSLLRCVEGPGSRYQAGKLSGGDKEMRIYGKPPASRRVGPWSRSCFSLENDSLRPTPFFSC